MFSDEKLKEFAQYEIYEVSKATGKKHVIAICDDGMTAEVITKLLAGVDPMNDEYSCAPIATPGSLIAGGGEWVSYQMTRSEVS